MALDVDTVWVHGIDVGTYLSTVEMRYFVTQ